MAQLACTQALLEADPAHLLSLDDFSQHKKNIARLEHQLSAATAKLTLELNHLPLLKHLHHHNQTLHTQLTHLRTASLQHLVAILALGFNRLEHQQPPSPASSIPSHRTFDGPHLFANSNTPERKPAPPGTHRLKEEIDSLKSLLSARDATIAEQASDLSLLELEVETLKQSLADQSTTHKQQASARSRAERSQIDSLRKENGQLSQALDAAREQASAREQELALAKKENSNRQSEQISELNKTLATRAREADERAREASHSHAALESQIAKLTADLESTRELGARALDGRDERVAEGDARYAALEAAQQAEWQALAARLTTLSTKLHEQHPQARLVIPPVQPGQQAQFVDRLVDALDAYLSGALALLAAPPPDRKSVV